MPTYRYGNSWDGWDVDEQDGVLTDLFLIPSCSTLRNTGYLVMEGVAEQAARRFSSQGLPHILGNHIKNLCNPIDERVGGVVYTDYNLLISPRWEGGGGKLGLLQTKRWPRDKSPLDLVISGIESLAEWLVHASVKIGYNPSVHIPFPTKSSDGLSDRDIKPHLDALPDSVYIWRSASKKPLGIPADHPLHEIVGMTQEAFALKYFVLPSMKMLYNGAGDEPNDRLVQYLAMRAYDNAVKLDLPKPETSARHVSRSQFSQLKQKFS